MQTAGFLEAGNKATYYRPADGMAVLDAHLGNVVRNGDTLEMLDVIVTKPVPQVARHLIRAERSATAGRELNRRLTPAQSARGRSADRCWRVW